MNLVDSSAWLAYFADEANADRFAEPLASPDELVVPSIAIYEVFKVVLRESGEERALRVYGAMSRGLVVELGATLAVSAARLSTLHRLPAADSIVLATAYAYGATLWTQDSHFEDIPGVRYFPKMAP